MSETIHRKKLFGGRESAEQVHRRLAFPVGSRCACGSEKVAIRIRTLMPASDVVSQHPDWAIRKAMQQGGKLLVVDSKVGKLVVVGEIYACDLCRSTAERVAAKAPSWAIVEIERGPGPDKPLVQVA